MIIAHLISNLQFNIWNISYITSQWRTCYLNDEFIPMFCQFMRKADSDIPKRTAFPIKCMTQKVNIHKQHCFPPWEHGRFQWLLHLAIFLVLITSTCYLYSRNAQYSWRDKIEGTSTPIERTNKNNNNLRSTVLINQTCRWIKVNESNCFLVKRCLLVEWRFQNCSRGKKVSEVVKKKWQNIGPVNT